MKTLLVRPVLAESKRRTKLLIENDILTTIVSSHRIQLGDTFQQIILISLDPDDTIEVGGTGFVNVGGGTIGLISYDDKYKTWDLTTKDNIHYPFSSKEYIKKVIATQDQLSPDLIQKLVAEYNNRGMQDFEIAMDCEFTSTNKGLDGFPEDNVDWWTYKPKLTNGFVTVVEKKHNIPYPEEPGAEDGELVYSDNRLGILNDPKINGVDYENTPVPDYPIVYTEEEVLNYIIEFGHFINRTYNPIHPVVGKVNAWFNENKKKQ